MDNNEVYKLYQLIDVFINRYGYTRVILKQYQDLSNKEIWLFNDTNTNYQAIRISSNNASAFVYEQEHINEYLEYFKKALNREDVNFLDIHVNKDEYSADNEQFNYLNIDENYSSGIDLHNIYPEIYTAIHFVSNPKKEINSILKRIIKSIDRRVKNFKQRDKKTYVVTYILIAICIINFLFTTYLKLTYGDVSSIYVVSGADYKTFTLGLKQFYRLITYGFVHSSFIHLFCNLYSLYGIGRYAEAKYGHFKYLLIVLVSIVCGSLTQGILSDNGICLGLSAAIYGLLVVFIVDTVTSRIVDLRVFLLTIIINIGINFLSSTAWMAHLGGAIGGFTVYYYLKNQKIERLILCVVLLLCLTYKYVTINEIKDLYLGTDMNVLQIYNDLGLKQYANSLLKKLLDFYSKYGG